MRLKRIFHQEKLERDAAGSVVRIHPGAVKGVHVLAAKTRQHFTESLVNGGLQEGWLTMGQGRLTVKCQSGRELIYQIIRTPGHYCCHCEARIEDANQRSGAGTKGTDHVRDNHPGKTSPDPSNPSGYRREAHYTGILLGPEVNTQTPEQAANLERKIRAELHARFKPHQPDA